MAKEEKQYNFGGHKFDAELYLQNLRDNADSFLQSKTDWTPEQKEEWKHSYTNFTNALQEQIKNGTDRFSTDEFGTITDRNGEFSNVDSDDFYYDNSGKQISREEYDKLKARKQQKYTAFAANRQFANYANTIGKGLRQALAAKAPESKEFDYAHKGFASFWNKKYNPSNEKIDTKLYWSMDKDGQYTNRIAQTITDLDEYLKNDDLPDNVRANIEAYKNKLQEYSLDNKDFDVEHWKNSVQLAASRAGLGTWNNGFFNMGNPVATDEKKAFDINNDQDVIDRYELADKIAAHPEQRKHILDLARRQYNQESQDYTDQYNAAIKQEQDARNNKIWETYLANEGKSYGDVTKRSNIKWYGRAGYYGANTNSRYQTEASRQAMRNLQAALAKTHWDSDAEGLFTPLKSTLNNGVVLNNIGEHLAYYLPMLKNYGAKFYDLFDEVEDSKGHKLWRVKNSKNKAGQYLYIWNKANGLLGTYRDVPFDVKKAEVVKGFYGIKIQSAAEQDAEKQKTQQKENQKVLKDPNTPEEKKRQIASQRKPGQTEFTASDIARITAAGADIVSTVAAFVPVYGTAASAITGVGSSLTNFGADLKDNSVSLGDSFKNLGTNLAMDAVGLVPGFGAAGKAGKITKTLVKYVPRIITVLSAANALSPESRESWKKLVSNESLTVKDWQNIAAGCSALAGVTRGTVGHVKANAMAKGTKTGNFNITASDGKQYKVTAEQLETLKKQKSLEDINKEFKKIYPEAELDNYFRTGTLNRIRHAHFSNPQVKDDYDFSLLNDKRLLSDANIWRIMRQNNMHGRSFNIPNPYKNSLLRATAPSTAPVASTKSKYVTFRTYAVSKNPVTYSPLRNTPDRYSYVRKNVQSLTGKDSKDWRNIFQNNGFFFKQGGSIRKFDPGGAIDQVSILRSFVPVEKNSFDTYYTGDQVGMTESGAYGQSYTSQGAGLGQGRIKTDKQYSSFTDEAKKKAENIENQANYKRYTDALVKSANEYINTPEAERGKWNKDNNEFLYWSEKFDNQFSEGNKGRFFAKPGVLNTSWTTTNNDSYNNPAATQDTLEKRIRAVRNDQQLAGGHNDREREGKTYSWEDNGKTIYISADDVAKLDKEKFNIVLNDDNYSDDGVHWLNYKITPIVKAETEEEKTKKPFDIGKFWNNIDPNIKWGIPRAMAADATNRKVTDLLKKQPLLLDPQEDHRYVQSDLDAEMNGQAQAAALNKLASEPITSDANIQSQMQLDAAIKGNEATTAGRQQSNQRLRDMSEQAWQQEVINHTNRHNTAMDNRQSIYNTANENKALEASYLNQKFTIWDTLAQQMEYKDRTDQELKKARADAMTQSDINNSIKYGLHNYIGQYGLTKDDVSLWNQVYTDGTLTLDEVSKDPVKLKQWNKVLSATRQIQQDLLGEYYGIPKSKYWTVRQSTTPYTYSTEVKKEEKKKKGGTLNINKVREAAKGEKLAVAQLKAQTADADRFYKTTKDTIDRMYDAIDRAMNYSSTKKKRKKKKK